MLNSVSKAAVVTNSRCGGGAAKWNPISVQSVVALPLGCVMHLEHQIAAGLQELARAFRELHGIRSGNVSGEESSQPAHDLKEVRGIGGTCAATAAWLVMAQELMSPGLWPLTQRKGRKREMGMEDRRWRGERTWPRWEFIAIRLFAGPWCQDDFLR